MLPSDRASRGRAGVSFETPALAFSVAREEAAAAEIGVPFLGRLPLSANIRAASDAGNPPAAGEGPEAAAFAELAARVAEALETVRR